MYTLNTRKFQHGAGTAVIFEGYINNFGTFCPKTKGAKVVGAGGGGRTRTGVEPNGF